MRKKRLLTDRLAGEPLMFKDIIDNAAQQLQEEIDWEVLCGILKEVDWVEIKLEWPRMSESLAHEIKEWCRANLKGDYKARGRTWMFSQKKDATLFVLRWSYDCVA